MVKKLDAQAGGLNNPLVNNEAAAEKAAAEKAAAEQGSNKCYIAIKDICFLGGKRIKAREKIPKFEPHVIIDLLEQGRITEK